MYIKRYLLLLLISLPLFGGMKNLSLNQAIKIVKQDNLELKIARFNEQMKHYEAKAAEGYHYGKLDVTVMGMRSNDAGNVFGFKLQSREATFDLSQIITWFPSFSSRSYGSCKKISVMPFCSQNLTS